MPASILHPQSAFAFVALGSNLGDSRKIILDAMARLQDFSDQPMLKSSLWQTSPVNCPPGSSAFVNAVVGLVPRKGETPESLLEKFQELEKEFGRSAEKYYKRAASAGFGFDCVWCGNTHLAGFDFAASAGAGAAVCASAVERNRAGFDFAGRGMTVSQLLAGLPAGETVTRL